MRITPAEQTRVRDAIRAAETGTSGDFVCVLARNASTYAFYPLAWASVLALASPWPLLGLTAWTVADILLTQLAIFAAAFLVLSRPSVRRHLVPRTVQRAAAHRAATEQFFIRGLAGTSQRRGVLIYVAHEEHYARILADDGAADAVAPEEWRRAVDLLVAEARHHRHTDGFVAALDHCGAVMARALPPETTRINALPDRFFVID